MKGTDVAEDTGATRGDFSDDGQRPNAASAPSSGEGTRAEEKRPSLTRLGADKAERMPADAVPEAMPSPAADTRRSVLRRIEFSRAEEEAREEGGRPLFAPESGALLPAERPRALADVADPLAYTQAAAEDAAASTTLSGGVVVVVVLVVSCPVSHGAAAGAPPRQRFSGATGRLSKRQQRSVHVYRDA